MDPGKLCGAGQGVEHDVHAIAVGVSADLLGEIGASRIVDMLNTHVVQERSPLRAAGRREDRRSRGAGDRDRRLSHATGRGVDQHLVTGPDPGEVMQAVPGGGIRGGNRGGLCVGQVRRQRRGQAGVTGDECAPATVGGYAPDMVADPVIGDIRPNRRHHAREIDAQLRQLSVDAGVSAERDQDIGEVDAGCADSDLDLPRPWLDPVERDELHGLQVAGGANPQPHTVVLAVDDGGSPLLGAQRGGAKARGEPRAVSPGGLVLVRAGQQLARHQLGVGLLVDVDLGGAQLRMLGANRPQQAAQSALFEIDDIIGQHRLRVHGHDI